MEILTLEGIYTGMTDKASGNKEITQRNGKGIWAKKTSNEEKET